MNKFKSRWGFCTFFGKYFLMLIDIIKCSIRIICKITLWHLFVSWILIIFKLDWSFVLELSNRQGCPHSLVRTSAVTYFQNVFCGYIGWHKKKKICQKGCRGLKVPSEKRPGQTHHINMGNAWGYHCQLFSLTFCFLKGNAENHTRG